MWLHIKCLRSVKLHLCAHVCHLCVIKQPDLMYYKSLYMCAYGIDFQCRAVMYLCLESCFLAGVTKRLCVCVWARCEHSHSSPALTYLRLHEAKTASMISFSEHVLSHRYEDDSRISNISIPWNSGGLHCCVFMLHHSNVSCKAAA